MFSRLSGRDMIGIAFTGSGKTLVFVLPIVVFSLEQELKMPFLPNEGPFGTLLLKLHNSNYVWSQLSIVGLIVCPSRELAKQILETVEHFADCLSQHGMPRIKSCLIIGGTPVNQSLEIINRL